MPIRSLERGGKMPNKDYHTNDTSLGSFNGQNAAFESDTNHASSNGDQLNDIFFSPGDPYGPNHGHIVTNNAILEGLQWKCFVRQ